MKKIALFIAISLVTTVSFSQDKMNKKMDNKTDKMTKKMENKTDKMKTGADTGVKKTDSTRKARVRKVTKK